MYTKMYICIWLRGRFRPASFPMRIGKAELPFLKNSLQSRKKLKSKTKRGKKNGIRSNKKF